MGSAGTRLWLLAFLAIWSLISPSDASPLKVMSAPNLLRVGTAEKIFVECQDCINNNDVDVTIKVVNFPSKSTELAKTSVTLKKANKFQELAEITIRAAGFSKDPTMKQYVYLQAFFPDAELEKIVLVSFQSGYIFIQTDKTLYTPNSVVHYRMFGVKPSMEPVEMDKETKADPSINIEIVTPNKITLPIEQKSLISGLHTGTYTLGDLVSPGLWTLVAKFQDNPQQSFTAEFEVKEYVLPSFEVKLLPNKPYILADRPELSVSVSAMYLFGQEVSGVAYIIFGVQHEGRKNSFPSSIQRVLLHEGKGAGDLKKQHIAEIFPNIHDLVGGSVYVTVSVLTENGGEMVEAELKGIQIVTSPYTINLKKTPSYFKPGIPFDVVIEVTNPDGTPAVIDVLVVEPYKIEGITKANGIARLSVNTKLQPEPLTITTKTNFHGVTQASATMTATPYTTSNNHYIHIGLDSDDVQVGHNLKVNLIVKEPINAKYDITYLILSKGQLVKHGRTAPRPLSSETVTITKDMLPSFRIVAYYHTNDNEVVSDSVWVDVKDTCMGSLKLEPERRTAFYAPRKMFKFKVIGDPGATVGLVAVDKGVYVLNNKHRLSQKKIWDMVESHDTGCTPGGGKDAVHVFHDAGLLFKTNLVPESPHRQETKCPAPSRRKRASTIMDVRTSLVSQYEEKMQRACCLDGMRETPLSYDCDRRSEYITEGEACVAAFLRCCKELRNQQDERRQDSLLLARSEEEEKSYMNSDEIVSRSQFPESWMWKNIKLPSCPDNKPCDTQALSLLEALGDSITTWQITAISLSATHSICVADPLEIYVQKLFFIDLRLPYSAVRGEQLEIKAILHNYNDDSYDVIIDLIENSEVCSSASKRGKYRQKVHVGSKSTRAVPFVIIPMNEGELKIEVKAFVLDSDIPMRDGIQKKLLVVPAGVLKNSLKSVTFQLNKKGDRKVEVLNSEIAEKNLVPNTRKLTRSMISVTGREQLSALVENALSGQSMGTLIKQPSGCGEQNMISMTLPVIATIYLDKTNQWETVGFEKRKEALQHIRTGYHNELVYRKSDGSFAVFTDHNTGSTWLTAYVTKVFAMASDLVVMHRNVICDAVKFLMEQQKSGEFTEGGTIIHGEMIGDVKGTDSDVSMTAFCLIALQESSKICNETVANLANSRNEAVNYLENRLDGITNSYAAAIASYALANENKLNLQILNKFKNSDHWPVHDKHLFTLEATAYALLALVKTKAFDEARPVVRWFNQQQIDGGGYGSTQATIMVYQAIAEYWVGAREEEYDVNVEFFLPDRSKTPTVQLNRENHYVTRTSKVNSINNNVTVVATGKGEATVKMVSWYYALPEEKKSSCQKFNLSVQLIPEKSEQDEDVYKLKIDVLYKDKQRDATMTILDIGLLTGFTVNTNDLNLLSKGYGRSISKYEMEKVLSDRGSLVIYLDKVSHKRTEEVAFRMTQTLKVGVLQPAPVSVYEYYDHQHNSQTPCVKFYHPQRKAGELLRLCQNNECVCAEDNCSMQKKEQIDNDVRTTKACESQTGSRIDFVYKVRLENLTAALATDVYAMRVIDVIKQDSTDVAPDDKPRMFLSFPHCRVALNLKIGQTYLVMGTGKDISTDTERNSFQYLLNERTWIEYWPSAGECQTKEHRPTCVGMEHLIMMQRVFGCQMK